jgi:hypothetical protein
LKAFMDYAVRSTRNKESRVNQLVEFLCKGEHPIEATLREKTREAMKEAIARGHVPIKFTDTRGGTELVVPLDPSRSDLRAIENKNGSSEIKVVGDLTLDYVPVTCVARIDLATLQGEGHLEVREA